MKIKLHVPQKPLNINVTVLLSYLLAKPLALFISSNNLIAV